MTLSSFLSLSGSNSDATFNSLKSTVIIRIKSFYLLTYKNMATYFTVHGTC